MLDASAFKIMPDETLGSVLSAYAWNCGEDPRRLVVRLWPQCDAWTRDIDRGPSMRFLQSVAAEIKREPLDLESTLMRDLMARAGVPFNANGYQWWLNPVGVYHRIRLRFGQLYCPGCLNGACRPYLQRRWRLSSSWVCLEHACLLLDSCPRCHHPFLPYRNDSLVLLRCSACSRKFRTDDATPAKQVDMEFQAKVDNFWQLAVFDQPGWLSELHKLLTHMATTDPQFVNAGETWGYWRIAERRDLLLKGAIQFDTHCAAPSSGYLRRRRSAASPGVQKRQVRFQTSKQHGGGQERVLRAHFLLKMAQQLNLPRREPARLGLRK